MKARPGNNPKRQIAEQGAHSYAELAALAEQAMYVGSAHHKRHPGNYAFQPPSNPRAWKSLCDAIRPVLKQEASELLRNGILKGMISKSQQNEKPKYVWSVDSSGEPYEAISGTDGYHGYRLEDDDNMRNVVLKEWSSR